MEKTWKAYIENKNKQNNLPEGQAFYEDPRR